MMMMLSALLRLRIPFQGAMEVIIRNASLVFLQFSAFQLKDGDSAFINQSHSEQLRRYHGYRSGRRRSQKA